MAKLRRQVDGVLVRFGEIGIKSPAVRNQMLGRLQDNLLWACAAAGVEGAVVRRGTRLWMQSADHQALVDVASSTFGVVSCSPAVEVASQMDEIARAAIGLADGIWRTFAIRARREGDHAWTSPELARTIGSAVWEAREAMGSEVAVDLGRPDLEIHLDVRGDRTFAFVDVVAGPGGLPTGCQGNAVAILTTPASVLAAWFMMRRGARVIAVGSPDGGQILRRFGMRDTIIVRDDPWLEAARLAKSCKAEAIVAVEPGSVGTMPVLRPLWGMPPEIAQRFARRAGIEVKLG